MKIGKLLGMIDEDYLRSEVSFGFELEAVIEDRDDAFDPSEYLEKYWGGGEYKHDASVKANGNNQSDTPFEYASPVLRFTPGMVSKLRQFLNELPKINVYTNFTCSFHTHVSLPDMTDEDMMWVVMQMAVDEAFTRDVVTNLGRYQSEEFAHSGVLTAVKDAVQKYAKAYHKLTNLDVFHGELKYNPKTDALMQAGTDALSLLPLSPETNDATIGVASLRTSVMQLAYKLTSEKFSVVRMHPQGTLEWRGPRSFLDTRSSVAIMEYIRLLFAFVDFVRRAQASRYITTDGSTAIGRDAIMNDLRLARRLSDSKPIAVDRPGKKTIFDSFSTRMDRREVIDIIRKVPWLKKREFNDMKARLTEDGRLIIRDVYWMRGELTDCVIYDGSFNAAELREGTTVWNFGLTYNNNTIVNGATMAVATGVICTHLGVATLERVLQTTNKWVVGRLLIVPESNTESEIAKMLDEADIEHETHFDPFGDPEFVTTYKKKVNGKSILTVPLPQQKVRQVLEELGTFWRLEEEAHEGRLGQKLLNAMAKQHPEHSGRIKDIQI